MKADHRRLTIAVCAVALLFAGCVATQPGTPTDTTKITAAEVVDFTPTNSRCTAMFTNDIDSSIESANGGAVVTYRRNVSLPGANYTLGEPYVDALNDTTYAFDVPVEKSEGPTEGEPEWPIKCKDEAYARYNATIHVPSADESWQLLIRHNGSRVGQIVSTPNGSEAGASAGGSAVAGTDGMRSSSAETEDGDADANGSGVGYSGQTASGGDEPAGEWGMSPAGELVNVSVHRARGQSISVDGGEMGGDAEYIPENDSVRFPTAMSSSGPVAYETESLAEFAEWQCGEAALEALRPNYTQPGSSSSGLGPWNLSSHDPAYKELVSQYVPERHQDRMLPKIRYREIRENESRTSPNVPFTSYLDRIPRTVNVSVTIDGEPADCTVPVFVERHVAVFGNGSAS